MVFDSTAQITSLYRSGVAYGNEQPTYVLLDKRGIVRFRSDGKFNKVMQLADSITAYIAEP